jgi:hypothetical protein
MNRPVMFRTVIEASEVRNVLIPEVGQLFVKPHSAWEINQRWGGGIRKRRWRQHCFVARAIAGQEMHGTLISTATMSESFAVQQVARASSFQEAVHPRKRTAKRAADFGR